MNKIFEELKEKCKSTLKETSKDEKEEGKKGFLTDLEKECINFDKLKEEYIRVNKIKCSGVPSSCDALLESNNELCFIEFKNGSFKDYEIIRKIYDSLLIFLDLTGKTISFSRQYMSFYLVYNKNTNLFDAENKDKIFNYRKKLSDSKRDTIKSRFQKLFLKNVFIHTKEDFQEKFVEIFKS